MAPCVHALLLVLCLVHGYAVPAQHTHIHVGMSKLSAVAAFMSVVAGEENAAAKFEEGDKVVNKAENEDETEDNLAEGKEDAESLLEEAEEDEEGAQDKEGMDEEREEGEEEEDDEFEPQQFMEDLDKNKDGKLSLTEIKTDEVPKEREQVLTEAFNRFDRNKDKSIDSDELPALVEEFNKKGLLELDKEDMEDEGKEESPENLMRELDTNKDSGLSFTELVGEEEANLVEEDRHKIMDVFQAFDKNKDGKLDMQELPSAMKEMEKRDL